MPTETARKNHDELFPGHVSTLAVADPELIEYFDNFAFDEVLRYGDLDDRRRLMMQLAALIGAQALSEYSIMLGAALTVGVTPVEVKEIVYQAVPYVGMGKAFDFLHATNELLTERGIELPLQGQSTTTPETRAAKGLAVQQQIVGADRGRADVRRRGGRRAALPTPAVGKLRRRPLHPDRDRPEDPGAAHLRHPRRPRRCRCAGPRPRRCEPQRRQRPRHPPRCDHPAVALAVDGPSRAWPLLPSRTTAREV